MTTVTKSDIESFLSQIQDPHTNSSLTEDRKIKDISIDNSTVRVNVELGYPAKSWLPELKADIEGRLAAVDGVSEVLVEHEYQSFFAFCAERCHTVTRCQKYDCRRIR